MPMSAGAAPLKIGVHLPFSERQMQGVTPGWRDIVGIAQRAEDVGFDSLWIADHLLFRFEGIEPRGGWECLSLWRRWPLPRSGSNWGPWLSARVSATRRC